jgi:hypothetical protein
MTIKDYKTPNKIYSDIRSMAKEAPTVRSMLSMLKKNYDEEFVLSVFREMKDKSTIFTKTVKGERGFSLEKDYVFLTKIKNTPTVYVAPGLVGNEHQAVTPLSAVGVSIKDIANIVSSITTISVKSMKSKSRRRELVEARQMAMYFAKDFTSNSLKTIGAFFGGRDHSTVIHAVQTMKDLYSTNKKHKELMNMLFKIIEKKDNECRGESSN